MDLSTPAKRLKHARSAMGWTQEELARRAGLAAGTIGNIEAGARGIDKSAVKLAKALGVSPLWLTTGEGQQTVRPEPPGELEIHAIGNLRALKQVPVVGEVKGGMDGFLEELQYPVGHGEGTVDYPSTDAAAYALRVRGDSMHPRYRAGEFIVVAPSTEPQLGDDVVVSLRDGRKLLKQLNWIRDGEVQLLSINDGFAPLTIPLDEVLAMHLVDGRVRRTAFKPA